MLNTYRELFTYFLDGIKKTYTATVHPDVFVRIFNEWGILQWTADNMSVKEGIELTQKQIDDLQNLLVEQEISRISNNTISLSSLSYKYRRLGNIRVKVNYDSQQCDTCNRTGISEWMPVKVMRIDQEPVVNNSVFRKPSAMKVYYKQIGNNIIFDTGNTVDVVKAKIQYYRYPQELISSIYDSSTDLHVWSNTTFTDLYSEQKKEILDNCIKIYLERVKDDRYKTFLQQQSINDITKS